MNSFFRKLGWLFQRNKKEAELAAELRFHIEEEAEEHSEQGLSAEDAQWAARGELGNLGQVREDTRSVWGWPLADELSAYICYAVRGFIKSPGFTSVAVLSLAVGIGVTTAIFSLVDAVWLRPIPVSDAGEITRIFSTSLQDGEHQFSWPEYREFNQQAHSFSGVVALGGRGARLKRPDGTFELLLINVVSENFFPVLGIEPAAGRLFTPQDKDDLIVALGYDFWQRHYGGDRSIIGKQIRLEGGSQGQLLFTVCGILPEDFGGINPSDVRDIWMPPQTFAALRGKADLEDRTFRWFHLLGRIQPNTSVEAASAEVATIASRLARNWPESNRGRGARAISDFAYRIENARVFGLAFLAFVLLVLVMSTVNVANLLLARASARVRELSIRASLGAGVGRLMGQLLTESSLLGLAGLLLGVIFGWALIQAFPAIVGGVPGYRFALFHAVLDSRVFAFVTVLALLITLFFGIVPSVFGARVDLNSLLREGAVQSTSGRIGLRRLLIGTQVALSFTLLALAAVLTASFARTRTADLGIARNQQLLLWCNGVSPANAREALARLRALPGVQDASFAVRAPLSTDEGGMAMRVSFPGRPEIDRAASLEIKYNAIDHNFLRLMGTNILRGRSFDEADETTGPHVVLISQTMAARYWPHGDALGATVQVGAALGVEYRVVGIVQDVQFNSIDQRPESYMYLPWYRDGNDEATFILNTHVPAQSLADVARQTLLRIDRKLDPFSVTTEAALIRFSGVQYELSLIHI